MKANPARSMLPTIECGLRPISWAGLTGNVPLAALRSCKPIWVRPLIQLPLCLFVVATIGLEAAEDNQGYQSRDSDYRLGAALIIAVGVAAAWN